MELGEPDHSGRRSPKSISGSEFRIEVDAVITAIGQRPRIGSFPLPSNIRINPNRTLNVDPLTLQTDLPWVFAGGDAVSGPKTIIEAVAAEKSRRPLD